MAQHPHKKLTRSFKDRRIAGVCGGLAEYFRIDSTLVRLIFLLFLLPGGVPGVLLYLLAWLLIPNPPIFRPSPYHHRDTTGTDYTETLDI